MRYILKFSEPADFTQWKKDHPEAKYKDLSRAYRSETRVVKQNLRASLRAEQHALCCYCECRLPGDDFHIEHFKPKDKDQFPELQLEYNNMHACCQSQYSKDGNDTCGHRKGNFFSSNLVSPLEPDCADHFSYSWDGSVTGIDPRGSVTIKKLNLNSLLLQESRKNLLDYFIDNFDEEHLNGAIAQHLDVNNEEYGEYFTMVSQLFRPYP